MEYTNYVESNLYKLIINDNIHNIKLFLQSMTPLVDYHQKYLSSLINNKWTYQNIIKILDNKQSYTILIQYIVLLFYLYDHQQYTNEICERNILKMLFYLFYILIPQLTNIIYTIDEKINILYYCMNIYAYINNHHYVFYCYEDLNNLLKSNL